MLLLIMIGSGIRRHDPIKMTEAPTTAKVCNRCVKLNSLCNYVYRNLKGMLGRRIRLSRTLTCSWTGRILIKGSITAPIKLWVNSNPANRKKAKLSGQFKGIMKKAQKGSSLGRKQRKKIAKWFISKLIMGGRYNCKTKRFICTLLCTN